MNAVLSTMRATLAELFAWWIQELRDTRTFVAERYAPAKSPRFQLQLFGGHGELARIGDATGERRAFKIDGDKLPLLEEVWTADKPRNARLDVVLPDAEVLVLQLQLPPMGEQELSDAVELQLERKLPLPRELLYVAWEITRKFPDRSRHISVAAARRANVDGWRDRLRPWGWRVARVCCRDLDGNLRFNFIPRRVQRVSFAVGRREALLAWSAAGLVIAYGLVTAGQWAHERISLRSDIQQARAALAKVQELRAALERESRPLVSLQQLARAFGAGSALAALSGALPGDTWLYQTEIRAGDPAMAPTVTIEGYTPSASTLVQAFEQDRHFEGIQLVETSATEVGMTLNRVKLKAQLRAGEQP